MTQIYIPENLPEKFTELKYGNEIAILCHLIYTNITYDEQGEPYPYSQLQYSMIKKWIPEKKIQQVIRESVELGIIKQRDEGKKGAYYVVGYQSKLYQLGPKCIHSDMITYTVPTKEKVDLPAKPKHNLRGIHLKLYNMLSNLTIDPLTNEQLRQYINDRPDISARGQLKNKQKQYEKLRLEVDKIQNRDFYGKVGENNGRFISNLTNIRREARKHILSRGKKLKEIDMKCTQPYIFYNLLLEKTIQTNINHNIIKQSVVQYVSQRQKRYQKRGEIRTFLKWETLFLEITGDLERFFEKELKNSLFYDNIKDQLGISRDEAKVEVLRYFFGQHDRKDIVVNKYFLTNYPHLHMFVGWFKRNDKAKLARLLQKKESDLFIRTIAKRIVDENPDIVIYTIHDAIVYEEEDDNIVPQIVIEELNKVFKSPNVKRKYL